MSGNDRSSWLFRAAPGLQTLLSYKAVDFPSDLIAGLSVAAVALPVGVAYAQLAGFAPEYGLYASILPLAAYALFGTSRQLIVGPDAATCALVAAAVTPLAAGDPNLYVSMSMALAFLAGVLCIAASFLKLGVLADFLSKPILVGFLNGMALSIALGQVGKVFGFAIEKEGIVPRLLEFASKLGLAHWPTLTVGAGAFALLLVSPKVLPRVPAALVVMALSGIAVKWAGLEDLGVKTIGPVPAGLPPLRLPAVPLAHLPALAGQAAGLALISFSSLMLTARGFAARNRYEIDGDREFAALGAANIAAAISQAFAISGADSRTAMNDSAGGRTQVTGLVTAAAIAVVMLFFTGPLQYVPIAALGAVLLRAAYSLLDIPSLKTFYSVDWRELAVSLVATTGVAAVGAIDAILVAVILALLRFVQLVSRPKVEILGRVPGLPGVHGIDRHPGATTTPGLLLFRFNAPVVFFNAPFFKRSALAAAESAGPSLKWFVLDLIPVTMIDVTGLQAFADVAHGLKERGVAFIAAGRQTEWSHWVRVRGLESQTRFFPTLKSAAKAFQQEQNQELPGGGPS